jgi:hypothetical protein
MSLSVLLHAKSRTSTCPWGGSSRLWGMTRKRLSGCGQTRRKLSIASASASSPPATYKTMQGRKLHREIRSSCAMLRQWHVGLTSCNPLACAQTPRATLASAWQLDLRTKQETWQAQGSKTRWMELEQAGKALSSTGTTGGWARDLKGLLQHSVRKPGINPTKPWTFTHVGEKHKGDVGTLDTVVPRTTVGPP